MALTQRLFTATLAVVLTAGVPPLARVQQQTEERFETTTSLDYLLYVPDEHDPSGDPVPLLLFLHGAGERGADLQQVAVHGPPKLIAAGQDFPAIVVSPQAPAGDWWSYRVRDLLALLDDVTARFNVDEDRVYVTGLSMGGYGTWALLQADPQRFAAAIPICGGGNTFLAGRNRALRSLPVWVFHGDADRVVPVQESIDMVEAIRGAGGENVELTVYPGVDHDSWTQTYDDLAVWEWLWSQRRGGSEPSR